MDEMNLFVAWFEDPENLAKTKVLRSNWILQLTALFPERTAKEVQNKFDDFRKAYFKARSLNASDGWGLTATDNPPEKAEQRGMYSGGLTADG